MKRAIVALLAPALALAGCASTVSPVTTPLAQSQPQVQLCAPVAPLAKPPPPVYAAVDPKSHLNFLVCALHAKANENFAQAKRWENRSEWRDLPMIAAAATIAGLVLFGERQDGTKTLKPDEQDAIAAVGFGAATFAAFANYLSPQKAREILRQSARGHYCMATEGELILRVYDSVDRTSLRNQLAAKVLVLSAQLDLNPGQFGKPDQAKAVRDAANKAIAAYDLQVRQLDTASISLGETAWNFGLDLVARSDRSEQNVDALVKAISEQTASATKFATTAQAASDPVPKAVVQDFVANRRAALLAANPKLAPPSLPDDLSVEVATDTARLLDGLVNVEALVLGFDKCAATALAGGDPKADRIQRVTLQ